MNRVKDFFYVNPQLEEEITMNRSKGIPVYRNYDIYTFDQSINGMNYPKRI